jgi:hypothetical protein
MKKKSTRSSIKAPSKKREKKSESLSWKKLQVQRFIEGMGAEVRSLDKYTLIVANGLWQVTLDDKSSNELWISFHVGVDPSIAAYIISRLRPLSQKMEIQPRAGRWYAYKYDEAGMVTDMLFDDEAYRTIGVEYHEYESIMLRPIRRR